MANKESSSEPLKCSFCGKSQKQVIKLIAGPGVYICDECIELCVEIIEEEKVENLESQPENYLPLPKEINQSLNEYVLSSHETAWQARRARSFSSAFFMVAISPPILSHMVTAVA